jgi:predicted transposase YbfD/YdcC
VDKSRGRIEIRQVWVVAAAELAPYLAAEWGWVAVQQVAWVRRMVQRRRNQAWTAQMVTVVTSVPARQMKAADLLSSVRGHWRIENRVHRVRDVSYDEDRLHGRQIAQALAWARNTAISLIRRAKFAYIPDGWSFAAANGEVVLGWLTDKPEN